MGGGLQRFSREKTMDGKLTRYLQQFLERYQDYKPYWNYEDGCVLVGCQRLYEAGAGAQFASWVRNYLNRRVDEQGQIPTFETQQYNIDSYNSGKALFLPYRESGVARWMNAINYHMRRISEHPRCDNGSFWHKSIYPHQIWLDGLYMALPFYLEYDMVLGGRQHVQDIMKQFENVRKLMYSDEKQLSYHACDTSKQMFWADKQTGCSPNFWLRSMGWYLMALVDCAQIMDEMLYEHKRRLMDLLEETAKGILRYRNEEGLFYQVIDRADVEGNYSETSGSAMVAYAMMKGARIKALNEEFGRVGRDVFNILADTRITEEDGQLRLQGICHVAGLGGEGKRDGSVAYYLSEPIVSDDAKGVGPFMMACAEAYLQDNPKPLREVP